MELLPPRDDAHPEPEETPQDREPAPRRRAPLDAEAPAPEADASRWELPPRRPRPPRVDRDVSLERPLDAPLHESWRGLDVAAANRRRMRRPVTTEERLEQSIHLELGSGHYPPAPQETPEPPVDPISSSSLANSLVFRPPRALSAEGIARRREDLVAPQAEQRRREAEAQAIQVRLDPMEQARQARALEQQQELSRERARLDQLAPLTHGSPWPWAALSLITGGAALATFASMSSQQLAAVLSAVGIGGLYVMYYVVVFAMSRSD